MSGMQSDQLKQAVILGSAGDVVLGVEQALESGVQPLEILDRHLVPAMREVGDKYERGEFYVPEMLVAARAMQAGMEKLRPLLATSGFRPLAKVALGTVRGDLHDIGKNLVGMMLQGAGFEIIDLGVDVSPAQFVEAVEQGADVVAMSALLTTTMHQMEATVDALRESGLREKVKILVGGAPLTPDFAESIGADGYGKDAAAAPRLLRDLMGA
jgi:5-methyltetrahydrofolate--homocysteine methyltransferase